MVTSVNMPKLLDTYQTYAKVIHLAVIVICLCAEMASTIEPDVCALYFFTFTQV